MPEETKGGSKSSWPILAIVGVVLVLVAVGFFAWRYYQAKKVEDIANQIMANPDNFKNGTSTTTSSSTKGKIDQNLVSSWDTGCLVPDPNSPWAEQHTFTFDKSGKAVHTRLSGASCAGLTQDHEDDFNYSISASNQIDFTSSAGNIYDIYQISGNTLLFGHGFCNCSNAGSATGGATAGDRFTRLNDFLKYQKK